MLTSNTCATDGIEPRTIAPPNEFSRTFVSAVSWGAVLAGAVAAAALSLILLMLGIGLGLSSASPWGHEGIGATAMGLSAILWLAVTQLLASGMGGYLAGRLRTKWIAVHADEVYFRDTAHGFLAWAVATLATAALLTSTIGSIVSGGASLAGTVASTTTATAAAVGGAAAAPSGMAKSVADAGPIAYFVDSLFRSPSNLAQGEGGTAAPTASTDTASAEPRATTQSEITRIFNAGIPTGSLSPEDSRYIAQVVAQRTGLNQQEAEQRVSDTYARVQKTLRDAEVAAKNAADKAREASAYAALWMFISLLIGAFIASLAATYGGRHRDR